MGGRGEVGRRGRGEEERWRGSEVEKKRGGEEGRKRKGGEERWGGGDFEERMRRGDE